MKQKAQQSGRIETARYMALHIPFLCFIFFSPLFLQMCSREDESSKLRIVNGTLPETQHPAAWSAVALVDPHSGASFCSGTLIAPTLVVTAAHCIFDKRPEGIEVVFGPLVKDPQAPHIKALAKDTFKKVQKFESNFDIGWVKLAAPAPSPYRPIEIWQDSGVLQAAEPLTIAGYGRTASLCKDGDASCEGGQLRYVDTSVQEFVNNERLYSLIVIGPRAEHGPCFGDSGGPAYLQKGGKWYLAGDFMGWDRLLVSEELDTICDTGHAIYNFVGDYVQWIEASSGVKLNYDPAVNPRPQHAALQQLAAVPHDFAGWCAYTNHEDPAWFTVQRLLRLASDFRIKAGDAAKAREIFSDCAVAEEWLRKMIAADPKLSIPGFDPANFVDSARLEDIRPLASLGDMGIEELILSDHSIGDLSPIESLRSLRHLEIIDNTEPQGEPRAAALPLRIEALPLLEDLRIHNSFAPIALDRIATLTKLGRLELSYLSLSRLDGFGALPLKELSLESITAAGPIDISPLEGLEKLSLNKLSIVGLPARMPRLEDLDLSEVVGVRGFPLDMPSLKHFVLYASDYAGSLDFYQWKALEELSVISNQKLKSFLSVRDLPMLRSIEITSNAIPTIESIARLPRLSDLTLSSNGLTRMPSLSELPALLNLDLDSNSLKELGDLSGCSKLTFLNLNRNPLEDLRGLKDLPGLRRLSVQGGSDGGLKSLEGMANLPALEDLNLAKNSVVSLAPLSAFTRLRVVVITDNDVTDLSPLKTLDQLEYVEAVNNPLKDKTCPSPKPDVCRFEWFTFGQDAALPELKLK